MNTTGIFTNLKECRVIYKEISLAQAKKLVSEGIFESAIGHESTIDIINTLLDLNIKKEKDERGQLKRLQVNFQYYDEALCFQVATRPPEGKILTLEELKAYAYKFTYLEILPVELIDVDERHESIDCIE